MDGAVAAHRQRGAQRFFALLHAQRYHHDFADFSGLFQAHSLFHGNFVKRVHRHFHIADIHIRTVGLHPHLHVVIHHPLYGNQCFHEISFSFYLVSDSLIRQNGLIVPIWRK